jgi:hypothetical protein
MIKVCIILKKRVIISKLLGGETTWGESTWGRNDLYSVARAAMSGHRVDKTYRDGTDRCKHCGRLRYHVPTFFQVIGRKLINCACSASLKWVVIRLSSNQMHASSNLPSMRTKKVGTLVTSLYVSTLWSGAIFFDSSPVRRFGARFDL